MVQMKRVTANLPEILGVILGCALLVAWLLYIWRHSGRHYSALEQLDEADDIQLQSVQTDPQEGFNVWIVMTWKGEDWLRRIALTFAFKLFGRKMAWASHWTLMIERDDGYSYFELERQRDSDDPVRCQWSFLSKMVDDSPDFPLDVPLRTMEPSSTHYPDYLTAAIPELEKRMYVGQTSWSDLEISNAGTMHFQQNFPPSHDYGIMNNNCQTFVYMLARIICPQSRLLLIELPGVAPTVLRLLDLPPAICLLSSAIVVMGAAQVILAAIATIAKVDNEEKRNPVELYMTHVFILFYAVASVLDRRSDGIMSGYHPNRTIALDQAVWASPSSFHAIQNIVSRTRKNRGFFCNKYEIFFVIGALMVAMGYTFTTNFVPRIKMYYSLCCLVDILMLSFTFIGPYSLFADLVAAFALIVPFCYLAFPLWALLGTKDSLDSSGIVVYCVYVFVVFPIAFVGQILLALDLFRYHIFNT